MLGWDFAAFDSGVDSGSEWGTTRWGGFLVANVDSIISNITAGTRLEFGSGAKFIHTRRQDWFRSSDLRIFFSYDPVMGATSLLLTFAISSLKSTVYVSPSGNDAASGTKTAPFATLGRAQRAKASAVVVTAGSYSLGDTLVEDNPGTAWSTVGNVSVSGGVNLGPWTLSVGHITRVSGLRVVTAALPSSVAARPRQLFVDGVRARRAVMNSDDVQQLFRGAKITDTGYSLGGAPTQQCAANFNSTEPCCGQPGNAVKPPYICPSANPICKGYVFDKHFGSCGPEVTPASGACSADTGACIQPGTEFVYPQSTSPWTEPRCAVNSSSATEILMMQPCWYNLVHKACGQHVRGPPNIVEAMGPKSLSSPGDWAIDTTSSTPGSAGTVHYALRPGETVESIKAVVPSVTTLLEITAPDVSFTGFTFEHATWLRPGEADGFVEQQTGNCAVGTDPRNHLCTSEADAFWSIKTPGNIVVKPSADRVAFRSCEFTRLGGVGVDFNAMDGVVDSCYFHDVSGAAVQIGSFNDPNGADKVKGNQVINTIVIHAGVEYRGAAGINVGYTQNTSILNNDVSNLTYGAISVGWGWSRHACAACTNAGNNTIAGNRAHHYKQELNDGGGIYMLGPQNGSEIHDNWVFDQVRSLTRHSLSAAQ